MQKLYLGKTNRVFLDTEKTVDSVKLSLVDAVGAYVKDSGNNDLKEKVCSLEVSSGNFYFDVTFYTSVTAGIAYVYWDAELSTKVVLLEGKFSPEDSSITSVISTDVALTTPTEVMDHFLRGISEDEIESSYVGHTYREVLRHEIQAATEQMEQKTLVYFTIKTITAERHDYTDMTSIYEKYWQNKLYHIPIIEITQARLMLNKTEIVDIPDVWIQPGNLKEGIIKIMPFIEGGHGLSFRFITKAGFGIAIALGSGGYYIPDFFEYTYDSGLDWDNLPLSEKTSIQNAIGRRVAINMLPILDTHRGISSQSRAIDNASTMDSYTSSAMYGEHSAAILQLQKQEKEWIDLFKRKYMTRLQMDGF